MWKYVLTFIFFRSLSNFFFLLILSLSLLFILLLTRKIIFNISIMFSHDLLHVVPILLFVYFYPTAEQLVDFGLDGTDAPVAASLCFFDVVLDFGWVDEAPVDHSWWCLSTTGVRLALHFDVPRADFKAGNLFALRRVFLRPPTAFLCRIVCRFFQLGFNWDLEFLSVYTWVQSFEQVPNSAIHNIDFVWLGFKSR